MKNVWGSVFWEAAVSAYKFDPVSQLTPKTNKKVVALWFRHFSLNGVSVHSSLNKIPRIIYRLKTMVSVTYSYFEHYIK
jgi:hypothetical protein